MTQEEKMNLIRDYIHEIENLSQNQKISSDDRLHYKKAYNAYSELYTDVLSNKFDANMLHESLTDYLYVFGDVSTKH